MTLDPGCEFRSEPKPRSEPHPVRTRGRGNRVSGTVTTV